MNAFSNIRTSFLSFILFGLVLLLATAFSPLISFADSTPSESISIVQTTVDTENPSEGYGTTNPSPQIGNMFDLFRATIWVGFLVFGIVCLITFWQMIRLAQLFFRSRDEDTPEDIKLSRIHPTPLPKPEFRKTKM